MKVNITSQSQLSIKIKKKNNKRNQVTIKLRLVSFLTFSNASGSEGATIFVSSTEGPNAKLNGTRRECSRLNLHNIVIQVLYPQFALQIYNMALFKEKMMIERLNWYLEICGSLHIHSGESPLHPPLSL